MMGFRWVVAAALCAGCSGEGNIHTSEDIPTDQIFPGIELKPSGGNSMRLEVRLSLQGDRYAEYVVLSEGDRLEASFEGQTVQLPFESTAAIKDLGPHQQDMAVTVALVRTAHASAPSSTLSVPAQFTLSSPQGGASYSRASDDILVEWSPSGTSDDIVLDFVSNCSAPLGGPYGLAVADTGSYTIEAGTLVDPEQGGSCELWAGVARRRAGTLDPAFAGGHVYAEWRETVRPISTP